MGTKVESKAKILARNTEYKDWLATLKQRFSYSKTKAVVSVNRSLLQFYWELGLEILDRQERASWGDGFLGQLSRDLMKEFPDVKGFSKRNLEFIRRWVRFWNVDFTIAKQAVSQLLEIPWGHNLKIVAKCASVEEAAYYVQNTREFGWSRSVLTHQIDSGLYNREGKAVHNFATTLPAEQSDLAAESMRDPYVFDFLSLSKRFNERDLEQALVEHMTQFLLELGAGFAYIGKQVPLKVGERDFYMDLLFYHTKLHCFVVVELKTTDFDPEHAGKLNFYIKAVDELRRSEADNPTIGILLCKHKDKMVAEYSLSDIQKPIGVSEYQLTQSLPQNLRSNLPSIEEIESELGSDF